HGAAAKNARTARSRGRRGISKVSDHPSASCAGHSRSKNGVASLAYRRSKNGVASLAHAPRVHPFAMRWIATPSPAMPHTTSASQCNAPHLLRLVGAGGEQEREIGAGRDVTRAHPHVFGGELGPRREPADPDMLAVLLRRCDHTLIGLAHARVLILAREIP